MDSFLWFLKNIYLIYLWSDMIKSLKCFFLIQLSYQLNDVNNQKFLFHINKKLFVNYWLNYIPDDCCTMHKIIKLNNIISLFTQSKLNKSILNLYQNELLGYIPEVIKIWPALTVLNFGNRPIPMFVLWYFEYSYIICVLKILSENKTSLRSLFVYIHKCAIYIKDIGS